MRTRRTTPQRLGAALCALTIIAATLGLLADPAAAAVAPTITAPTSRTVASNEAITFKGNVAITVADPDSSSLRMVLSIASFGGGGLPTMTLASTAGLTFTAGDGTDDSVMGFRGSVGNINQALNGLKVQAQHLGGAYFFAVSAEDNLTSVGTSIQIDVTDNAPTVTAPADFTMGARSTATTSASVADTDSHTLKVTVETDGAGALPLHPNVTLGSTTGITLDAGTGVNSYATTFHGSVVNVNEALTNMTVTAGFGLTPYTLKITVADAIVGTPNTATDSTTITQVELPLAPTGLASRVTAGQIFVSWTAPPDSPTKPITGYRVIVRRAGTIVNDIELDASTTAQFLSNLTNGSPHTVSVSARNANGEGPPATTSTLTPQVFLPFASANAQVDRIYLDILGRAPSSAERTAGAKGITNGTARPGALVAALRANAESTSTVDPVTRLYRAYFLRVPDPGGLNFWIRKKRSGTKLDAISQSFAKSNEFKSRYGDRTNAEFIDLIYDNLFGRDGDPGGVAFWTKQLNLGKKTRGQVMIGFSESNEYKTKQAAEVETSLQYIFLLGRRPTLDEFTSTVFNLEHGVMAPANVADGILPSEEYEARVT